MSTIPVSEIVRITPAVLPAGGSAVALTGLILTTSPRVPIGSVASFSSTAAVGNYFGATSLEARNAEHYFPGFLNSNKKPRTLLFMQYPLAAVAAYIRGGDVSALTLAQLQAFSGTLTVSIDAVVKTGSVNLSGATSFTNAAEIIANVLDIEGAVAGSVTGSISGTTFTAASGLTGAIAAGQVLEGVGVTEGTYILAQLTGPAGGLGTYSINASQTVGSEVITFKAPAVAYDTVSGGFIINSATTGASSTIGYGSGAMATDLKLTLATGAVLSQGAVAATPAAFMNTLVQGRHDFSTWMLNFNPDNSGNDIRFAFATWNGTQSDRYAFVSIDDDAAPTTSNDATACLARRITGAEIQGVSCNWQPVQADPLDYGNLAAFVGGTAGSIDFDQLNGRTVFKFRRQSSLVAGVTDQTVFDNLKANGYNCYGAFGDGDDDFTFYADGVVSGDFVWMDSYCNQIALNSAFRNALVNLLLNAYSIPYNSAGRAIIEAALADAINKFLAFGAYRAGVSLSASQVADVNASAGKNISDTLTNQGWYLDIGVATPEVRAARGSPPMTFYYVDGQSVQEFDMASIVLL
jgi:hypothetical protein